MEKLRQIINRIFNWPRSTKRITMYLHDGGAVIFAAFLATWLTNSSLMAQEGIYLTAFLTVVINHGLRLYSSITRHISMSIMLISGVAAILSTVLFTLIEGALLDVNYSLQTAIVYYLILYSIISGSRLLVRSYFSYTSSTEKENIIIYGAGSAGQQLVGSLTSGQEYNPVAFIDDNIELHSTYLNGVGIHSPVNLELLIDTYKPTKILLALPAISRKARQSIINKIENYKIAVQSIPNMADIVSGKMKIDQVQDVSIDDLLGRDAVPPKPELFTADIQNKVVMVTGAGGSIGSELCRQILRQGPKQLLLFELSEYSLYAINKELELMASELNIAVNLIPLLGSVQKSVRMNAVLSRYKVDTIYHAAAYKHVPLVEYNIIEGIQNNIIGTRIVLQAAIENKVDTFILVSTDKAVRPTNIMGATKRIAELVLQAYASIQKDTRIAMVRFGNVLGSSGSVVPLFKDQINNGGPVTVTHKDITRYFMTIPEAAQLVIQAGAMAKGGDVFVLDMGEPVKIIELAEKMIHLMGFEIKNSENPDGEIEIQVSGLRPGEKLYEELLIGKNVQGTEHPRIMTADEDYLGFDELNEFLVDLKEACSEYNYEKIRELISEAPTGFNPNSEICDHLFLPDSIEKQVTASIVDFPRN